MKIDRHLTPDTIANYIVNDISQNDDLRGGIAADFSCASGRLMRKIIDHVEFTKIVLNDIDGEVIDYDLFLQENLEAYNLDFENDLSAQELHQTEGYNLIIINPPYSIRGNKRYTTQIGDLIIKSSRVLKHILQSLSLISREGVIYCIVPTNIFSSETDQRSIRALSAAATIDKIEKFGRGHFTSASVETVLIRIKNYDESAFFKLLGEEVSANFEKKIPSKFTVERGNVSIHKLDGSLHEYEGKNRVRFIHTTNMTGKKLHYIKQNIVHRVFSGKCILMPRVGTLSIEKLVLVEYDRFIVSDCIIVITGNEVDSLLKMMREDYERVKSLFSGHCAKYTTLTRINNLILEYENLNKI
ncbi:N-6 DNA methylase [Deinococcus marmoris]|uniref:N-6 DNA methylase n=1 Tax=Deinococcus marmoris TaxID=249408 RepID=UPI0011151CC4|nr:N-6 DNA methylase [Deinococcus marmoris]